MVSKDAAKQVTVSGSHKCGSWEIVSVGYSFPRHCYQRTSCLLPTGTWDRGKYFNLYCIPLSFLLLKSLIGVTVLRQTQVSKPRYKVIRAEITEHKRNSQTEY